MIQGAPLQPVAAEVRAQPQIPLVELAPGPGDAGGFGALAGLEQSLAELAPDRNVSALAALSRMLLRQPDLVEHNHARMTIATLGRTAGGGGGKGQP